MIREIMVPDKEQLVIDIPREYLHKEVEVLVFPIKEEQKNSKRQATTNLDKYNKLLENIMIDIPANTDIDTMINEMYDHDLS